MHNSKTKWFIGLITIALMLTIVGSVSAQNSTAAQSNVLATLSVDSDRITVGDVIPLTLHVTHPAGWRVIVPTLEKQWGDFEVRDQSTPSITANGDGTETTVQKIEVARMRPGEVQTPALTLSIADDQGNLQNIEVAPIAVTIQSVLVAGDTTLRDIKPQADLITFQSMFAPVIIVVALILSALLVYAVRRWRNRPVIDKRTPRQRALATLQALAKQNPQTPDGLKSACVEIAACLRNYIAATTPLVAHDLTTNELARQLNLNNLPADWSTRVIEMLRVCDSVKFAGDILELTTINGLINTTKLLIEQYPPVPAATQPAKHKKLNGVIA